jgi:kynureninase
MVWVTMSLDLERAAQLDRDDPLARFRSEFVLGGDVVAYLDGNSLGRLPRRTAQRLSQFVASDWGEGLIRGWSAGWADLPGVVGDELAAGLLGAAPGQTVVADSTSVNLFKVVHAAFSVRPGRNEIVVDDTNFPTDRYIVESVAAARGAEVRWISPDLTDGVQAADLERVLGERTAAVVLSHVDYRSGALADLPAITQLVHAAGAVVVWDLCHSVGVVPLELDAAGVDFAVGCTYKYLNAGPGAPAFLYVAARHVAEVRQPITGWWGAGDPFAMARDFEASDSIRKMLSGTPNVAGLLAVREGVALSVEADIAAIRAKSEQLTAVAYDALAAAGYDLVTTREPQRRGGHVTVRHPRAREVTARLVERGVVPDFREPDMIRLGLAPLTTSFAELAAAMRVLGDVVASIG